MMKNNQFSSSITTLGEGNMFFVNATDAATEKLWCEDAECVFLFFFRLVSQKHLKSHMPFEIF